MYMHVNTQVSTLLRCSWLAVLTSGHSLWSRLTLNWAALVLRRGQRQSFFSKAHISHSKKLVFFHAPFPPLLPLPFLNLTVEGVGAACLAHYWGHSPWRGCCQFDGHELMSGGCLHCHFIFNGQTLEFVLGTICTGGTRREG